VAQHQSVWHAIHMSVEFLQPDERERFLELAVFPPDETIPESAIVTLWAHTGHCDEWESQELLATMDERSLIQIVTRSSEAGRPARRHIAFHDLVYDYIQGAARVTSTSHQQLLAAYEARCPGGWPSASDDGYVFTHLFHHLTKAGREGELADLLWEPRWLEA